MIIRKLEEKDIKGHVTCSSQAFCYCASDEDLNKLPNERVIAAFLDDNETLTAEIEVLSYVNNFCGNDLKCAAVGGVASRPEFRRQGSVRALFDNLFNDIASKEGFEISILYPFSTSYYRLFGYETAGSKMRMEIPFKELQHIARNSSAELFDGKKLDELLKIYNAFARQHNLSFIRNSGQYFSTEPLKSARWTYLWKNNSGEYRGYVTYSVNRNESKVNVSEIGWLDKESLLGIIGFLRSYDGNQSTLVFESVPLDCPIIDFVANEQNVKRTLSNMGAVRIIDVLSVLNKKSWPKEKGSFTMKLNDPIEKNRGTFRIEYADGKAVINKTDCNVPDVELDENAASRFILIGASGANELEYYPGAVVNNKESDFFKAFTPDCAFFVDGF